MITVTELHYTEATCMDARRLEQLVVEFGDAGAERLIRQALQEVAVNLSRVARAYRTGDSARAASSAWDLALVAAQVGLTSLAGVARAAYDTLQRSDPAAKGAVVARLMRIGEQSLMSVGEHRGASV